MAERIETQASALQGARDHRELRVLERTSELGHTNKNLEIEIADRKRVEEEL